MKAAPARRKIRFALNLLYNEWNESITDFPLKNVGRLFDIGLVHGCGLIASDATNFILNIKHYFVFVFALSKQG